MSVFPGEGLKASVTVGLAHWRGGETTLVVDSDHGGTVVHRRAGAAATYTGVLSPDDFSAFTEALNGVAGLERAPQPAEPDDAPVRIQILRDGGDAHPFAPFSYSDRYSIPAFNQFLRQFNRVVEQLSHGAISG